MEIEYKITSEDKLAIKQARPWVISEPFTTGVENDAWQTPSGFTLKQNYPNPFNPATTISFQLPKSSAVIVKVYNMLGHHVKTLVDREFEAGSFSIVWEGDDEAGTRVSSGVYLYRIEAAGFVQAKKLIVLK